jgi:crotonobetainyl-CoA:carnitine CoA-transferase CaiB-like acyl-CoA transferase
MYGLQVEQPGKGDALRSLRLLDDSGTSVWWRVYGRNRRCVTANLHLPEGRQVVKDLASKVRMD